MSEPTSFVKLESLVSSLVNEVERLRRDNAGLNTRLEVVVRENKDMRREHRQREARNAKAKSMLETLANQLPQG